MTKSKFQRFVFNQKTTTKVLSAFTYVIFVFLLITPFISSDLFVDSVLTPKLIWFTSISTVFSIVVLLYFLFKKSNNVVRVNTIDLAVFGFFIYLHFNHYFTDIPYISSKISISTAILVCYIALRVTLSEAKVSKLITLFVPILYITAGFTSIIALYQYVSLLYFDKGMGMTAHMGNSGAVGSYLAILSPWLFLFVSSSKKNVFQYLYRIIIVLSLITLFLTQARAAWVAVVLCSSILIVIKNRTRIKEYIDHYKKGFYLVVSLTVVFLLVGGYLIFDFKKDSANGRLFIWKRTVELILDSPLTGVGFAKYGSEYPEYQASYLKNHPNDPSRFLAGDINHPFNEYLNITVELGLIGILLFGIIFYFVFKVSRIRIKPLNNTLLECYGTIITFLILAIFTYPFEIFSVQFLLFCCIAIISSEYQAKKMFTIQKNGRSILMTITCVVMFFVSSSELERFQREKSWKKVYESRNNLSWKTRSKIFEELYPSNKSNWDFLSIYGIELTVHKQYQKAIPILQEATGYMKTSDIYTHLGISYEEITDYENSKTSYEMAIHMVPHKFFPKYRLVYLYKKMGLQKEALELAESIVITPAKVNSVTVQGIKYEMRKFLQQNGYR